MGARLRNLIEERANLWKTVQDTRARLEKDGATIDDAEADTFRSQLDKVDSLSKQIEDEERAIRMASAVEDVPAVRDVKPAAEVSRDEAYSRAFDAWFRRGGRDLDADQIRTLTAGQTEVRAAAEGTGSAGGYLVPTQLLDRMVVVMKAYGGTAQLATEFPTDTGNPLTFPSNDDTGNTGAIVAENTQITQQDFTFGQITLNSYLYTSKIVLVSVQLLQDSLFDLNTWIPERFGIRIGRACAAHFASGTGTGQPQGITVGLTSGTTMGTAGTLKYTDLVNLEMSVDPAYRVRGRAQYLFSDPFLAQARKIVDANNRPVWQPTFAPGMPDTLNGWGYTVDNSLPNMTAGNLPAVFGDIAEAYIVRRVAGASVLRLTERYADFLQVGFLAFARFDGKVQNASAAKVLTAA